jgi:hypothetical protein
MHTAEKQKKKKEEGKKTPPKQTETRNSKSTISGDDIYTPKKVLQNDASRRKQCINTVVTRSRHSG